MLFTTCAVISVLAVDPVELVLKCHKDDKVLMEKVSATVKNATKISEVEKAVGVDASINTSRKIDKEFFPTITIVIYSEISQIDSFSGVDDVVFWDLSVNTDNPIVVGVAWVKGEKKIFYGAVYPRG